MAVAVAVAAVTVASGAGSSGVAAPSVGSLAAGAVGAGASFADDSSIAAALTSTSSAAAGALGSAGPEAAQATCDADKCSQRAELFPSRRTMGRRVRGPDAAIQDRSHPLQVFVFRAATGGALCEAGQGRLLAGARDEATPGDFGFGRARLRKRSGLREPGLRGLPGWETAW